MKYVLITLALIILLENVTPSLKGATLPVKPHSQPPKIMQIQQTTVATIEGIRVIVSNIAWENEYTLPDGTKRKGHTAMIGISGQWYTVGQGSIITVGTSQWQVIEVKHGGENLGSITLERIDPKNR